MLIAGETECGLYGNCVLTLQFFCKAKMILKNNIYYKMKKKKGRKEERKERKG